jgi:hypothetical protein
LRSPYRKLKYWWLFVRYFDGATVLSLLRRQPAQLDFETLIDQAYATEPTLPAAYSKFLEDGTVPPLRQVSVELTNVCNLRCTFCDRAGLNRKLQYMNDDLFRKCIDELAGTGVAVSLNRFGESTLDRKLIERIKYAKKKGIRWLYFTSNATRLDEKLAREIVLSGLSRIAISYDGAKKETMESVRIGTKFEEVNEGIERLLRLKRELKVDEFNVDLRVTLIPENMDELLDIYRRFYGRVDNIIFTLAFSYENVTGKRAKGWDQRIPCPVYMSRTVVCVDGTQIMCCIGDINGTLKAGDVNKQSILEGYHGPGSEKFRDLHRRGDFDATPVCTNCTASHMSFFYNMAANGLIEKRVRQIIHAERMVGWLKAA